MDKKEKNNWKLFNLMISDDIRKKIKYRAYILDCTSSYVVREILEKFFIEKDEKWFRENI